MYLHIPKTGGNWLTKLLQDYDCVIRSLEHKHATYDVLAARLRSSRFLERHLSLRHADAFHYMAVVRNPLTWYESWFKYQTSKGFKDWGKSGRPKKWHVMSSINEIREDDFNDFVMATQRAHPGFVTMLYADYTSRSAAHILRNETIRDDFAEINKRFELGIPETAIFDSPEHGVSPKRQITWDPKVLEETIRLEQACFRAYDYSWDNVVTVG